MNRSIRDAIINAFHRPGLDPLNAHVLDFVGACTSTEQLKALRRRTPFRAICGTSARDRWSFEINPRHIIAGPNMALGVMTCGAVAQPLQKDFAEGPAHGSAHYHSAAPYRHPAVRGAFRNRRAAMERQGALRLSRARVALGVSC